MHADGAVVARVGIGQNGFRTIFGNDFLSLGNEFGPCFFPSDAAPLVRTLFADAFHRVKNAIRGIGVLNIGQPLYAGTSSCLGLLFSAAYVSHAAVLNAEFHQAAVSTVAQATVVLDRTSTLVSSSGLAPREFIACAVSGISPERLPTTAIAPVPCSSVRREMLGIVFLLVNDLRLDLRSICAVEPHLGKLRYHGPLLLLSEGIQWFYDLGCISFELACKANFQSSASPSTSCRRTH